MNWDQLKTILWLRWRLMRNQMTRSKGIGAAIAVIIAVATCLLGATSFAVALVGGIYGLGDAKPSLIWGIWFGMTAVFMFFWMIGMIQEIQRSESIDLQRLLHLPVRLGQIFVINYLASHLAVSIVLFVPAMMGLTLGLAISRGPAMLLLAPLGLGMVCMITAWTYCLRGWLATLMSNPRRRRTVVMVIMLTFILLGQAPNLYFNVFRRLNGPANSASSKKPKRQSDTPNSSFQRSVEQIKPFQKFIPPFWLPLGAQALAEGEAGPALLGTLGCVAIGALGLRRAYRSTLLFYRGDTGGKATAQIQPKRTLSTATTPTKAGRRFLELRLPGVPEQAAALAVATFRSLLRAPEVKIAWGTSILVPLIVGASLLFQAGPTGLNMHEAVKPFAATGAVLFSVFMLVQFFANQFGFDRDGFRALVLSPVDRRLILLGKNLACLPVGAGFGLLLLVLISLRLHLPPLTLAAAVLQLASLLLLAGLVGNVLSILAPYRIQQGTMKPTKMPALAMVVLMLCHVLFPIAMAPIFLPPLAELVWQKIGWSAAVPVNLILSVVLVAVTALAYWQTLVPLGQLLQRRETKILGIVTVEVD